MPRPTTSLAARLHSAATAAQCLPPHTRKMAGRKASAGIKPTTLSPNPARSISSAISTWSIRGSLRLLPFALHNEWWPHHQGERRAHKADDEGAPERCPEPVDTKSESEGAARGARQPQHQAVDDENEQTQCDDDERERQDLGREADECIEDAKDQR